MTDDFLFLCISFRLYSLVEGHEPVVLIVKTMDEEVIIYSDKHQTEKFPLS